MSGLSKNLTRRHTMRRKDAKQLLDEASEILHDLDDIRVEEAEFADGRTVYLLDGKVQLFRLDSELFPTLIYDHLDRLPSVIVDMGAIPYVCNGAAIMVPGIVGIEGEFNEGDLVVIRDVTHKKALAVGKGLKPSSDIKELNKGKVIENLHYVGDRLWNTIS